MTYGCCFSIFFVDVVFRVFVVVVLMVAVVFVLVVAVVVGIWLMLLFSKVG